MHDWKNLLITLRHISIWHNITHENLILEIGYATTLILQIQCFLPRSKHFMNFFSKVNLNTYCTYFFSGKLKFFWTSRHLISLAQRASF